MPTKHIPQQSYPMSDFSQDEFRESTGHCIRCGLPEGRVYPKTHESQTEEMTCFGCGATWFELKDLGGAND